MKHCLFFTRFQAQGGSVANQTTVSTCTGGLCLSLYQTVVRNTEMQVPHTSRFQPWALPYPGYAVHWKSFTSHLTLLNLSFLHLKKRGKTTILTELL